LDEVNLERTGRAEGFHRIKRHAAGIRPDEFACSTFLLAALAGMLALAGCAARQAAPPPAPSQARLARFEPFLVREPFEPYRARGAAQFTYRGESESGELTLQVEPGPLYRIQIRARISGSLALDLRFDDGDLLIVDYVHESYLLGGNTSQTRQELFSLDMNPLDFQIALTARVPDELFQRGQGRLLPREARFTLAGDEYRFTLDASGLPSEWIKIERGVLAFRVEYRSYLEIPTGQGPAVRLPERIRIYGPEARPRLILGIQEWMMGTDPNAPPITFIPPQDVLDRFRPQ
jgi:hypothetical protein